MGKSSGKSQKSRAEVDVNDLITQAEAAEMRGVSRAAITDLVKRGRLRTVELFGKKLLYRSEVENFEPEHKGWPKGKPRKEGN
jgi:excisionase family DNA binding protein